MIWPLRQSPRVLYVFEYTEESPAFSLCLSRSVKPVCPEAAHKTMYNVVMCLIVVWCFAACCFRKLGLIGNIFILHFDFIRIWSKIVKNKLCFIAWSMLLQMYGITLWSALNLLSPHVFPKGGCTPRGLVHVVICNAIVSESSRVCLQYSVLYGHYKGKGKGNS